MPDGVTEASIDAVLGVCIVSVDPVVDGVVLSNATHFRYVIQTAGLSIIDED